MRILFAVIFFLFTFANWVKARFAKHPYFDTPVWGNEKSEESDYLLGFASWSKWSHCSKSCGNGIQYQLRRCLDVRCSGISSRHRLCNTEVCPNGSRSTAEIEYKEDGSVKSFETSLPDGSQCLLRDESSGICFRGKCENIGCDLIIGSNAKFDQCGICGGNGETCEKAIVFKWKDTQQFSPCDKTCGSNRYQVSVSVCMNTVTNRVVPERLCADQKRPRPYVKECPHIVCPSNLSILLDYEWLTSDWSTCSKTCGNSGIKTRSIFCVETNSENSNVTEKIENRKVDEQYCWELARPKTTEICPLIECPEWKITGSWSECICDDGNEKSGWQKRNIECRQGDSNKIINDLLCNGLQRPTDIQKCVCSSNEIISSNDDSQNLDRYR
uniref:Uncharacterized protein n=1 Tax=Panagrolaimus sp. PS1159 TaxID=55785 RepID=A0AC35G1V5_9BILA